MALSIGIVGLPERRQEHPVQRADQGRRARGELPVRDDRAQRRRRRPARRAAGRARRAASARRRSSRRRCPSSTSRASCAARPRARAGATRSSPTSATPPRSARSCAPSPTRTWSTSTARSRRRDDIETINTELLLADLQTIEKALPRLEKEAQAPEAARRAAAAAEGRAELLDGGITLYAGAARPASTSRTCSELHLLTAKPFLYVFNVDEAELADAAFLDELRALVAPAEAIFLDAKIESELIDLHEDEAPRAAGVDRPARARPAPADPGRLRHAGPADVPHRRPQGDRGPGRSRSARPPPRPPASSTPTSSAASSRPRWSASTT